MKLVKNIIISIIISCLFFSGSYGYYTTRGQNIVDRKSGKPVILRGFGIGCWLLPEGYMWGIRKINRPRQLEKAIHDLTGKENAAEFWRLYHKNFLTEGDIRSMKLWGVNSIRIALLASLLQPGEGQPENAPYHYSTEGFALLDTLVSWCGKYKIGIIWDMHGAPGAQNAENISDSDGEARLWTEQEVYWPRCEELWYTIASRYRDRECIIGYDLLNEPLLRRYPDISQNLLRELYIRLTDVIRKVEPEGIIFIEGDDWAQNFTMLEPLDWDAHLAIAFHSYPPIADQRGLERWDLLRQKYNIPLWHGETGEQGPPYHLNTKAITFLEKQNVGWNWWTHKKFDNMTQPWNCARTEGFNRILSYWTGTSTRPSQELAKEWLFDQARKTHSDSCEFLPDMVRSLVTLDPDGYVTANKTVAPEIIHQPEDAHVEAGDAVIFYTRARGYPLHYQWLKNGDPVKDATEYLLMINNPQSSDDGSGYSVRVYNELGESISRIALLNIEPFSGPVISHLAAIPTIDGEKDACWEPLPAISMTRIALGSRHSEADISATFKAGWDHHYLYLWVEITDDSLSTDEAASFEQDGIEIYVDSHNSRTQYYGDDDFQFRFNWHVKDVESVQNKIHETIHAAQRDTETGYVMEVALPWHGLLCKPEAERFIGFDLHVNDNDGNGRECKLTWKAKRDNSYQSPSVFGTLMLGKK